MTQPNVPVILGIDENRDVQTSIAQMFNDQGLFYRFVTDRRKVSGGVKQLNPDMLVVFGELDSDFVIQVLDALSSDVASARIPVVVVAKEVGDAPYVQGLRTGVVSMLQAPFGPAHPGVVRALWSDVTSRSGTSAGNGNSATLVRLVEHIRRTRRSGVMLTNPRTSNEGRASFIYGRIDKGAFLGAQGQDALNAMLRQPQARWSFTEVAGANSEGAGVVIEVGEVITGETPVGQVIDVADDEPLAFEMQSAPPVPAAPVLPPPAPGVAQLLLVDDDPAILTMFSRLFTKHGFQVTTATDGNQGVEMALQRNFDAVLADLNMPHLDGWGMLRALREDFRSRELPVSFLSAHDDYRESLRALDAGAQAYLSKGTKLDVIVGQVVKLLEPRRVVMAMLELGNATQISIHAVGPQWLMGQLAARQKTGVLQCKDGWANYTLAFTDGVCTHASALAGKYTAEGERAFNAFIASRAGEGGFTDGPPPAVPKNMFLNTEVSVERACTTLNDNERRMRESLMVSATEITVNEELYKVYRAVGPKNWLEAARLICEEKATPRDVISRLDVSPVEIEECMKDLIRRGVVTLKKA